MRLFPFFPFLGRPQLAALLGVALAMAGNVGAATLTVTNTADSGVGSLRDVIAVAGDGDTIQFDAAIHGQTIALTTEELVIDNDITITGPGSDLLTVAKTPSQPPYISVLHIMPGRIVTIEGITISGGYYGGINNDQATLIINHCTVSGNFCDCSFGAGGITNYFGTLTVVNSIVSNNHAGSTVNPAGKGGGISSIGMLTIIHSVIVDNRADVDGGGVIADGVITITASTISNNRAGSDVIEFSGMGGGLAIGGTIEIRDSTISGNTARGDGSGVGGGIHNGGGGSLTIINSTISGNFANETGGGIFSNGSMTIANNTISGNWASSGAGGISNYAPLEIGNTILSDSGTNIVNNQGGTVTSHGYNLSSDNGGGFLTGPGDQINTNPMLGPLQDNGGPTFTHAPQTGSPAINAGDPNFTPPPLFDQRGFARVFGGRIDIGSVEVQPTPTPTPTPSATPTPIPSPAQALNISTRLRVETGNSVMIGGFIVYGGTSKVLAVRGIGPSLTLPGTSETLADPTLELRAANGTLLFQNDNWQDDPAQAAQLTSLGLAPQNPNESGLVVTLQPGAYTAVLAVKDGGTGVGLMEIYDTSQSAGSRLANMSTRGFVQTGDNVMIGGFILGGGTASTAVAVRGIGPSLAQSGLSNVLADPILELRDSNGALLVSNDNWQDDQVSAAQLIGHALAPQDPLESGIFATLPPGAFTAILAGKNSGAGLGLVEIYNVQ